MLQKKMLNNSFCIIARVTCSKEEALKVFPEFIIKEVPKVTENTLESDLDFETRINENKKLHYFDHVTNYLDFVLKR
jgi:hypothetical protein